MADSLRRKPPDFDQFLKVLYRKGRPGHLPFYEHIASPGFMARRLGKPIEALTPENPDFWSLYVEFWLGLGFDCIPLEIPLNCPLPKADKKASHHSEAYAVIHKVDAETAPEAVELEMVETSGKAAGTFRITPEMANHRATGGISIEEFYVQNVIF